MSNDLGVINGFFSTLRATKIECENEKCIFLKFGKCALKEIKIENNGACQQFTKNISV